MSHEIDETLWAYDNLKKALKEMVDRAYRVNAKFALPGTAQIGADEIAELLAAHGVEMPEYQLPVYPSIKPDPQIEAEGFTR